MDKENVIEVQAAEDSEEQKEPKEPKKSKKSKKQFSKKQLHALEERLQARAAEVDELRAEIDSREKKIRELDTTAQIVGSILILVLVALLVYNFFYRSLPRDGSYHSGVELKENFVNYDDKYHDGETIFNFEGYFERNGFKHWDISYTDDNRCTTVHARARNKYWGVTIRTSFYKESWVRADDSYSYETIVEFYRVDKSGSRDYSLSYLASREFNPSTTKIVMDTSSSLIVPRELLDNIDAVLKAKNHDGSANRIGVSYYTDNCPFSGLGIEHSVEVNNIGATPHDD